MTSPLVADTGLTSLLMMAAFHSISADEAKLRHEFGHQPFDTQRILLAAKSLGLSAKAVKQDPERITKAPLSVIEQDKNVKPHREVGRDVSSFTRVSEIAKNF